MANTTKKDAASGSETVAEIFEEKELNLDQKVTVRNIAGWIVGFARKSDFPGDVTIAPRGSVRLSRNEIIAQVQSGNRLFTGIDGNGNHATLIIDDEPTKKEIGIENQIVYSGEALKELFNKKQNAFELGFKELILTRAEKYAAMAYIKSSALNDYSKIRFAENYTGYKLDNV